jgi:glycosyltransferase involved in cell wall biosynthesis
MERDTGDLGVQVTTFPNLGLRYAWMRKMATSQEGAIRAHLWAGQEFCERVITKGLNGATSVYTFNSAGLELLQYAKSEGLGTFMEQTIAPREFEAELIEEEINRFPHWKRHTSTHHSSIFSEFAKREKEEWEEADVILCGSDFVKDAIGACGGPENRCRVVPYGVDASFRLPVCDDEDKSGPLRVLTVGHVSLRKGSPYVKKAAEICGSIAEFRMVGSITAPDSARKELSENVELTGHIPRSEVIDHYRWADVFLLPSLCEGSAAVCYEAMAAGLPVVCTPNTGSIVRDGKEGFIVPIRDADAIAERIHQLTDDPAQRRAMGEAARKRYEQEGSLEAYAERLTHAISEKSSIVQ